MDVDKIIGWNLRRIRQSRNLSQTRAANLMQNIDQPLMSIIERAERTISVITLYRLAQGLGINPGDFFNVDGAPAEYIGDPTDIVIPDRSRSRSTSA